VIIPAWTTSRAKKISPTRHRQKSLASARRSGAIVGETAPCVCGHAPEEHGRDPRHPGSTACVECECVAYEADAMED
jgi:hypothetical protein